MYLTRHSELCKVGLQFISEPLLSLLQNIHITSIVVLYFTNSINAEILYEIYVVLDEKLVYTMPFKMHLEKYSKTFVI